MAAGACLLCVVVLPCAFDATVAVADPETGASTGQSAPSGETQGGQSAQDQTTGIHDGVTGLAGTGLDALGGGTTPTNEPGDGGNAEGERSGNQQEPATGVGPMSIGTTTVSEPATPAPAATGATDKDDKDSDTATAISTPTPSAAPTATVAHSPAAEPSQAPEAPAATPAAAAPAADPPATAQTPAPAATQTAVNEVAPVTNSDAPAPTAVTPASAASPDDLITTLAYLLITLPGEGSSLYDLPGDVLAMLGFDAAGVPGATAQAAGGIGGRLSAAGQVTAARSKLVSTRTVGSSWPEMLLAAGGAPQASSTAAGPIAEGITASGVKEEHLSVAVSVADSAVPEQVREILRHTVGAVLAPLSLLVLGLTASPGIAGLTLLGVAGTFVGYRQAKAASVLRAVRIGRFVKAGPLGVVRSGGLVAVHSRAARAGRLQERDTPTTLESVA